MIARYLTDEWPVLRRGYAAYSTREGAYHAMVVAEATVSSQAGVEMKIFHMRPPLDVSGNATWRLNDNCWVGWIQDWDLAGYDRVCSEVVMVEQRLSRSPGGGSRWDHYDLGAHEVEDFDSNDEAETVVTRCSCASLVEHAYEMAGHDLVDRNSVPKVTFEEMLSVLSKGSDRTREMLRRSFARIENEADRPIAPWPCPVLLPAYQMRAFEIEDFPRKPDLTDHPFP